MNILGPRTPRAHLGGFRGIPKRVVRRAARRELRDDQSDPIQEHSFITSSFSLVVFGSPWSCSSSCRRLRKMLFLHREVGSDGCLRPKGWIRTSSFDLCTTRRWSQSSRRSSPSSTINGPSSRFDTRTSCSKISTPPQPQREREFRINLIRPPDTSKLKF